MKKAILISVIVLLCLGGIFLFLPNVLGLFSKDIPPVNDNDLQLSTVSIPPAAENSFYDVNALANSLNSIDMQTVNDMLAGTTWNATIADQILSNNSTTLDVFSVMAQKPYFQDPNFANPNNISVLTPIANINAIRNAGDLSALKAIKLARDGNGQAAFDEAEKSLQLGQNIENSQDTMIDYLTALSLKNIGLNAINQVLQLTSVPSQNIAQLSNFKENKSWVETALKVEYKRTTSAIDMIASGNPDAYLGLSKGEFHPISSFYFKPNETKSYSAAYYRAEIENSQRSCQEQQDILPHLMFSSLGNNINDVARLSRFSKLYLANMFNENFIGKIIYDTSVVDYSSVSQQSCKIDSEIEAIQGGNKI